VNDYPNVPVNPVVDAWAAQVVSNGGTTPSLSTRWAVSVFYNGLVGTGLLSQMLMVNCFAPDNVAAATTPLIQGAGFQPWVKHVTVIPSQLSEHGMQYSANSGTSQYWDTGFQGGSFPSDTDAGFTWYAFNDPGAYLNGSNNFDLGYTNNAGTQACVGTIFREGGTNAPIAEIWAATGGTLQGTAGTITRGGYLSANRTASNAASLYYANSLTAHSAIATIATTGGTRQAASIYVNGVDATDQANNGILSSGQCISFFATHHGLSSGQSLALFNLVQQMRVNMGGGFV
jgi:hypothetical protein